MSAERQGTSPLLEILGIAKSYGAVVALRNANLTLHRGEVVALVGDNGAGKSTLIKILSGSVPLDSGVIRFEGKPVEIRRPSDAVSLGIQTVYQDLALCDNLDIIDNIFLGREPRSGFLQGWRLKRPMMERVGREILNSMAIRIAHIDAPVGALSGGQRQCAAVCRAILGDPKVIVLDEPTAALGVSQTQDVLTLIARLKAQGRGVIVISHDIPDLLRVADRIVVLRLGETIADRAAAEWTEHSLVSAITGAARLEQLADRESGGEALPPMSTPRVEQREAFTAVAPTDRPEPRRVDLRQQLIAGLTGPWRTLPLIFALGVVWMFFAIESPLFLSSRNLTNLSNQIAVSSLLALALVFVVVVRQIDISLASLAAVCGEIAAHLSAEEGWNPVVAVALTLFAGVCVPTFQSWIVMKSRAPSFIVTLGGLFILNAALMWMLPVTQVIVLMGTPLQAIAGTYLPSWLSYLLAGMGVALFGLLRRNYHAVRIGEGLSSRLLQSTVLPTVGLAVVVFGILIYVFNAYRGVPLPAVIVVTTAIVLSYVGTQTPLGKHIYAIGGNPEAARRAGIKVEGVTAVTFAIAGFVAAWAGIINASRSLGVSAQSTDLTLLLVALSAVVIGGVSLFGGRGGIWAVLLGGILMGSIQNGLQLMAISQQVQWTVQGVVLVIAVVIDASISRHAANPN